MRAILAGSSVLLTPRVDNYEVNSPVTPVEKFTWRPAAGVRSTSEVYMHIAMSNFYLLSVTGPKMPADLKEGMEKTVTSKAQLPDSFRLADHPEVIAAALGQADSQRSNQGWTPA